MTTTFNMKMTGRARLSGEAVAGLVARAADGETAAWDALVTEFSAVVWGTVRALRLRDADADDAAQSTWMRLVEHLDRINDPSRVGPWLATTARRESFAVKRRSARLVPRGDDLPDVPADTREPCDRLIEEERAVAVREALLRLHPRDRALLRMLAADPAPSYEEIAAALDMPVGGIGPTRARALDRLGRELERAGRAAPARAYG